MDFVVVEVTDSAGNPNPEQKVRVTLPDGTVKELTPDSEGLVKIAATQPGRVDVEPIPASQETESESEPQSEPSPERSARSKSSVT
jgi:hypothetical protein